MKTFIKEMLEEIKDYLNNAAFITAFMILWLGVFIPFLPEPKFNLDKPVSKRRC